MTLLVVLAVFLFLSLSYLFSGSDAPDSIIDDFRRPHHQPPPPSQQRPPKKETPPAAKESAKAPAKKVVDKTPTVAHTEPIETPTAVPKPAAEESKNGEGHMDLRFSQDILTGGAIAPKLENATAKLVPSCLPFRAIRQLPY